MGKCRRHDSGMICPSYRATYEEAYSTRGRARLLFEMMRGDFIEDRWRSDAVHGVAGVLPVLQGVQDRGAPVNVDMATYKAEFMHHHYKGRLRPPRRLVHGI